MFAIQKINPVVRAVVVVGAVVALATGVTLSAYQGNTAALEGVNIATATPTLRILDQTATPATFGATAPGFDITDLVPYDPDGKGPGERHPFYLANTGDEDLTVTAHVPTAPTTVTGVELSEVEVAFWGTCTGTEEVPGVTQTTLQALIAGEVALPCNPLSAAAEGDPDATTAHEGNYEVQFDISADAIDGETASISDFDLVFMGAPVVTPLTND